MKQELKYFENKNKNNSSEQAKIVKDKFGYKMSYRFDNERELASSITSLLKKIAPNKVFTAKTPKELTKLFTQKNIDKNKCDKIIVIFSIDKNSLRPIASDIEYNLPLVMFYKSFLSKVEKSKKNNPDNLADNEIKNNILNSILTSRAKIQIRIDKKKHNKTYTKEQEENFIKNYISNNRDNILKQFKTAKKMIKLKPSIKIQQDLECKKILEDNSIPKQTKETWINNIKKNLCFAGSHSVLIEINHKENKILYKDPFGVDIYHAIKQDLIDIFNKNLGKDYKIEIDKNKQQHPEDHVSCSLISANNAISFIKDEKYKTIDFENYANEISKIKASVESELKSLTKKHQNKI